MDINNVSEKVQKLVSQLKDDIESMYDEYKIEKDFEDIEDIIYNSFLENNFNEEEQLKELKNIRSLMGLSLFKDVKLVEKKKESDKIKKKKKRKMAKKSKTKNRKK